MGSAPKLELAPVLRCLCLLWCSHWHWEDVSLCWTSVPSWQPLGGRMQYLSMCQRQSGVHQGKWLKKTCQKQEFFSLFIYRNKWMCSWHFLRWCVAGSRVCCQGRQGESFTPVQEVVNAWSTTSWHASLPLATSGGFVQALMPPQPFKLNVSPTLSIWTRAVLASPLYSTGTNYPQ